MPQDLETLRAEIETYLKQSGIPVFYGSHTIIDALLQVSWDTERHADFREFLETARLAGAKLIVFNQQAFSLDQIDTVLDRLEECDFTREEKRQYENRLQQLQAYEGFTSALQLSFTLDSQVYLFEVRTEWYDTFTDIA